MALKRLLWHKYKTEAFKNHNIKWVLVKLIFYGDDIGDISYRIDRSRYSNSSKSFIVIRPSAEGSPASTPGASDMLQRMQAYRGHPAQQA